MKAELALNPPRIQRIKLPNAPSLTWLKSLVDANSSVCDFRALLRHFVPALYSKKRPATQLMAYELLLRWLAERAPIDADGAIDWGREIVEEGGQLGDGGIPIILFGYDDYEVSSPARALFMTWLIEGGHVAQEFPYLMPIINDLPEPPENFDHLAAPPAGRRWVSPWDGLRDFAQWMTSSTGWGFLDYCYDDSIEFPAWNIDEVQSLIEDWSKCEPILNRIGAFNSWVDEKPEERLPVAIRALKNEPAAIAAITEPIL